MNGKTTNYRYLDALKERVLVIGGPNGTNLQKLHLTAEHFGGEQYNGCNDYLVLSYPQAVEQIHRSFLEAGTDALVTNTFRANRITLGEYGLADRVMEINRAAASLARRLADEYPGQRFVAGSIGPSGRLPSADDPELSNITFDELVDVFREQAEGLILGGADVMLIETSQDILETKAIIFGIQQAFEKTSSSLPIQAQVTLDTTGRMLLGTDIAAALTILEGLPIDIIGLNCSTGPEHMREPIRYLGENASLPVSCIPNAGLPINVDGEAVYPMEPEPFAEMLAEYVEKYQISVVGGCCGSTPAHIQRLVEKIHTRPAPARPATLPPRLSSSISAIPMHQEPPPLLLGERCNAQGSRKFKRLLLEENYDAILELGREQVEGGAHALDISVAVTERPDEAFLMQKVVKKLAMGVDVPLVIDTTEPDVMETALKTAPGRCLLNSTNLESGREKADKVLRLAKDHNAAVLVLTIDESGMAKTAARKLEVARRIFEIAVKEHDLRPEALVFDALTFTLGTGDAEFADSAMETLEGIRLIKQNLPGVLTSLGVSNVSFGLSPAARPVLNSIMLFHAVQAGLDMAIVNPAHITPYAEIPLDERELTEDLIFNRRPDALQHFIEHFEAVQKSSDENTSSVEKADAVQRMTPEERLHWRILYRHKEGVEADIDEIINRSLTPNPSPEGGGEQHYSHEEGGEQHYSHEEGGDLHPSLEEGGDLHPSPGGRGDGGEGKPLIKTNPPLPKKILERCRELRQNATDAEMLLWQILKNRGLHDAKFRRQHPVAGFILDFYCSEAKLAIELDGSGHLENNQAQHDQARTKALEDKGIRVLRFWNSDVLNNTQAVLEEIWITLEALTPSPSPEGGGEINPLFEGGGEINLLTEVGGEISNPTEGGGELSRSSEGGGGSRGSTEGGGELHQPPKDRYLPNSPEMGEEQRRSAEGEGLHPSPGGRGAGGEGQLSKHEIAVQILNTVLLPAMKEVGDRFGAGELILPFVLQSAEVMKKAVGHVETYLERIEGTSKGTIVLATVYGDVHDIGKNLVKTILANNGYSVVDLGKQVPAETIINKAVEVQAQAIGLSALLVSTSKQMPLIVNELHRRGLHFPVLIGGAAINRRFGWRILFTEEGAPYEPGVFYCKDAFEGLATMEALINAQECPALLSRLRQEAEREMGRKPTTTSAAPAILRSTTPPAKSIPRPASWGARVVRQMPLEMIFQHLSKNELFRLSWGAKNAHGEKWEGLKSEFETRLSRMQREALREGWLNPQGVYGYWPAQSSGDELILYDPASIETGQPAALARFPFPRQPSGDHLCLADYFAPVESGVIDVVALQVVTVGEQATQRFDRLQDSGAYSEAYYLHGLAVQTAEATAEYLHQHIRRELGLAEDQGKRYSWGYPAIPELEDHRKVFDLLPAEGELGMSLTAAYQLVPEQSTAAIIIHHPAAKYFSIGESRVEQLMKS